MRVSRGAVRGRPNTKRRISSSKAAAARAFHFRLRICCAFMLLLFALSAVKLVYIQIIRHDHYSKRALRSHVRERTLPAARGNILDRHGKPLAMSVSQTFVFVDPELFRLTSENDEVSPEMLREQCRRLASLLGVEVKSLQKRLQGCGRFRVLMRPISQDLAREVEALREKMKLRWVGLQSEDKRVYPHGEMAAQTLGFVSIDGTGLAGIESALDSSLVGRPGKVSMEVDRKGRSIPGLSAANLPPRPGKDITLTLDASLQQIAEVELCKGIAAASAAGGAVVIMEPNTGEILALATQPSFDPNSFEEAPARHWVNPTVVGAYEPGSTFKLVIACAILEEGIPLSSTVVVCRGEKPIGRRVIHCALHDGKRDHGRLDLEGIIEQSCNIGAATLALELGREKLYHYVKALGFGEKTGIELAAESAGQVPKISTWSDIRTANIAFGQSISVTPLQLLRAYCVVANGGLLVRPHLVLGGEAEAAPRVLSEATAEKMRRILVETVEAGTGKRAIIEGYQVAGKTGTSQKPLPGVGFRSGKYIASFVGFVPAKDPEFAILVLIDEPGYPYYGGVAAAPVFREIARQALLHVDIPPSQLKMATDGRRTANIEVESSAQGRTF
jgi:stage V sporulation protein D (sporulation-specific penicillin-binding protein)